MLFYNIVFSAGYVLPVTWVCTVELPSLSWCADSLLLKLALKRHILFLLMI